MDFVPIYHLMIDLGIDKSHFPCIFLVKFLSEEKIDAWKFKKEINKNEFDEWLGKIEKGEERKHLKAIPLDKLEEMNKGKLIKHLSALNFRS